MIDCQGTASFLKKDSWISTSNYNPETDIYKDEKSLTNAQLTELRLIYYGALFPYLKNVKCYKCPAGMQGEMLTYSIVDSMRGDPYEEGTFTGSEKDGTIKGVRTGKTVLYITNRMEIISPAPDSRMVFIDDGFARAICYSPGYKNVTDWTIINSRHSNSTTFSFADGHAERWVWEGEKIISNSKSIRFITEFDKNKYAPWINFSDLEFGSTTTTKNFLPVADVLWHQSFNGLEIEGYVTKWLKSKDSLDMSKVKKAVWGRLYNYAPTD